MAVRSSMLGLVNRLRSVTGAATDDLFNGVTYWTDEQLQEELDAVKNEAWATKLVPVERKIEGKNQVFQFIFSVPRGFWVEDLYTVRKANGEAFTPSYTVTYNQERGTGTVTFETPITQRELYIDLVLYDWNAAAASVWGQKAAHRFDYITIKAGDYRLDMHQEYLTCVDRAEWHRRRRVFEPPKSGFVPAVDSRWRRW